jgi:hypothetical protein
MATDPNADPNLVVPVNPAINFPSKWVYTAKDNNVVLYLPGAVTKKYTAVFYDELENKLFELTNLKEEYLIIEKVNFIRSGWYRFEYLKAGSWLRKTNSLFQKMEKLPMALKRNKPTGNQLRTAENIVSKFFLSFSFTSP